MFKKEKKRKLILSNFKKTNEKTIHRVMNDWRLHAEYLAEAWYLHINSIKPMFYGSSKISHFTDGFVLRCFQHLSIERVAALHALLDNRSTRGVESSFLSY